MKNSRSWSARVRAFFERNEFLRHVLALMTGTAAAQLLVMAMMPILSRLYSPEQYGVFAVYTSVVALVTAVATLRYDMAIMLPKQDHQAKVLKSTVTWIAFGTGILASGACLLLAPAIARMMNAPEVAPWLALVGVSTFTLGEISALVFWLNRKNQYGEISKNRVLQSGSTALTQVLLGIPKVFGVGGLILGTLVGQAISIIGLRRRSPEVKLSPRPALSERTALMKRYRRMPLLNAPTALIDAVRLNGINLLIGVYSMGALGQFSMAWRMVEVPAALISSALAQVFFQRLSVVERGKMFTAAKQSIVRSALFGFLPFLTLFLISPWVFPVFFGAEWDDAGRYAQALVPWLFMNLITSPISTIFVVTEKQHVMLLFSIAYMAVPLAIIWALSADMMLAVFVMGLGMAGMLVIFVVIALVTAKRFDASPNPDAAPAAEV